MSTTPVPQPDPQAAPQAPDPRDVSFDSLFNEPSQPAPAAPQAPPAPAWFLEAPTGTRYRTPEEAIAGIAQKDQTIATQQQMIQRTQQVLQALGIPDNIGTLRQNLQGPVEPTFVDVLNQSLDRKDPRLADNYIRQMVRQEAERLVAAQLAPVQPLVGHANMQLAVELASQSEPNIPAFVRSEAFKEVCKRHDIVGDAVEQARNDPGQFSGQLPKILLLAYALAGGNQVAQPAATRATPPTTSVPPTTVQPKQVPGTPSGLKDLPLDDVLLGRV